MPDVTLKPEFDDKEAKALDAWFKDRFMKTLKRIGVKFTLINKQEDGPQAQAKE